MANNFTARPWVIDTAAATVLTGMKLRVKSFRWVGAAAAGQACIVQDASGREVWKSLSNGANFIDESLKEEDMTGLVVPTLDAGKLYVELA